MTDPAKVAAIGYASVDHALRTTGPPELDRTVRIIDRPADGWGRTGGAPAYVCRALTAEGIATPRAISWVGPDQAGADYRRALRDDGIDTEGIAIVPDARTPFSVLVYADTGGCACLYDPGMANQKLSPAQAELIADTGWLVITVGPTQALADALDRTMPDTRVAWLVKADQAAFTPPLCRRLAERADLIAHNKAERAFIEDTLDAAGPRPGRLIVETHGANGLSWRLERQNEVPQTGRQSVHARKVTDQTGAGDTLAGGLLAGLIEGQKIERAILRGVRAVDRLMHNREAAAQPNPTALDDT